MYLSMNGGVPSLWAALTIDWWETESNVLLMSMKMRFSLCFCSLFFFMIALTTQILSAKSSPCLKAFWWFDRDQYVSILLLSTRWNNLPMSGPTVRGLKSPGLNVPCFWNTSNNSLFEHILTPTEQPEFYMGSLNSTMHLSIGTETFFFQWIAMKTTFSKSIAQLVMTLKSAFTPDVIIFESSLRYYGLFLIFIMTSTSREGKGC